MVGFIGETCQLFDYIPADCDELSIDLNEVTYVNSVGIKNWVSWIRRIPESTKVVFRNCPTSIVNQMSMVKDFLPASTDVESLQLPYHCDNCGYETSKIVTRGIHYQFAKPDKHSWVKVEEEAPCPQCKETMEVEVLLAKYFAFLDL